MSIQADVDRGLEIQAEIAKLEAELKAIEKRLEAAGLKGEQIALEDKAREGRQYIARGTNAQLAVIFTADSIVSSFADASELHEKLKAALGPKLKEFFKITWANRFKDGKAFRKHAQELLGDKAPGLITLCLSRDKDGIPKSKTTIAWHEAKNRVQESGISHQ